MDRMKNVMENIQSINHPNFLDILEFYNIKKFLKNGIYPKGFPEGKIKKIQGCLNKKINIFFYSITKEEIFSCLEYFFSTSSKVCEEASKSLYKKDNIDEFSNTLFRDDFLKCFEDFNLDKKISENDLENAVNSLSIPVWYFLKSDFFSIKYPNLIKNLFLSDIKNFELFLNNFLEDRGNYVLPANISKDELYKFCESYIKESSNLNFLELIAQGNKDIRRLTIDPKLKLKAQRKIKLLENDFFNNQNSVFTQSIAVYTEREAYSKASEDELKIFIDPDYITEHPSPMSLLNYLMYMDYFFNGNWILNMCSFPNLESSTLTRYFSGPKTKRNYETSFYFHNKNSLILYAFKVFQNILSKNLGLRIEDLLVYFFKDYCKNNFEIEWLPIHFAGKKEKINIQTKNLFIVEEQIRKQWNLLISEGEIDKELFMLESTPRISNLKSLLHKKYVYLNEKNENVNRITHLLFSDQSELTTIKNTKADLYEENFVQLFAKHKVKFSYFEKYQQKDINFLIKNNIIMRTKDDVICANKKQILRIAILSKLFDYGVIHYYNGIIKIYRKVDLKRQQHEIDEMLKEGLLTYKNTLFSKPESNYLNYILNDSEFDNALGIRNKYLHGSIFEDNIQDMMYGLIILTIYVIKINEELVLSEHYENVEKNYQ